MNNYTKIAYKGKDYVIFELNYKNNNIPGVLDLNDFNVIKKMNKNWRCNNNGFIFCSHTYNGNTKDVYLHELVMLLKNKEEGLKNKNKSIIHINRIGLDNRRENLIYDISGKEINKNQKKKTRFKKIFLYIIINKYIIKFVI